jgi:four helix bundle protein
MGSGGALINSYRDLDAWREAMSLAEIIYTVAAKLPAEERFALAQQLRRAATSVPSNIAEGHARGATRDFARFLAIARGSVAELETQLELAVRVNLLDARDVEQAVQHCDKLGRILRGLRKSLDNKLAARQRHAPPRTHPQSPPIER